MQNIQYKRFYIPNIMYISICQLQDENYKTYGIYVDFQVNHIFSDGIISIEDEMIFADEQALLQAQIASVEDINGEVLDDYERNALLQVGVEWITKQFYCNPCREEQEKFNELFNKLYCEENIYEYSSTNNKS